MNIRGAVAWRQSNVPETNIHGIVCSLANRDVVYSAKRSFCLADVRNRSRSRARILASPQRAMESVDNEYVVYAKLMVFPVARGCEEIMILLF